MNISLRLSLLLLGIVCLGSLSAQEKEPDMSNFPKYTVAVHPYYLLDGGMRVDFEKQLNSPRKWLQLSAAGYYLPYRNSSSEQWETPSSGFDPFSGMKGGGLSAAYKSIFYRNNIYYSARAGYGYYDVAYNGYEYVNFIEDGLTFYERRYSEQHQHFHKLSSSLNIGLQSSLNNLAFIDIYMGLGYSYSFYDKNKRSYSTESSSFGQRGLYFSTGLRLGLTFGR